MSQNDPKCTSREIRIEKARVKETPSYVQYEGKWGSGGITALKLKFGTGKKWVFSFTDCSLYCWGHNSFCPSNKRLDGLQHRCRYSKYSDQARGWISKASWFYYRQWQQILFSSKPSRSFAFSFSTQIFPLKCSLFHFILLRSF